LIFLIKVIDFIKSNFRAIDKPHSPYLLLAALQGIIIYSFSIGILLGMIFTLIRLKRSYPMPILILGIPLFVVLVGILTIVFVLTVNNFFYYILTPFYKKFLSLISKKLNDFNK